MSTKTSVRAPLSQDPRYVRHDPENHTRIIVWCNGTVQGGKRHAKCSYSQKLSNYRTGYNGCPTCGFYGTRRTVKARHPEVVERLVNHDDAELASTLFNRVRVWCDGTVQGHKAHERVEYDTAVRSLCDGVNSCPVCKVGGSAHQLAARCPQALGRLVRPEQSSAMGARRVELWCDGTAQGHEPHERVTYLQSVKSLAKGTNQCPACTGKGRA